MRGRDVVKLLAEEAGLTANIINETWVRIYNKEIPVGAIHVLTEGCKIDLPQMLPGLTGRESCYIDLKDPDSLGKIRSFMVELHSTLEELNKNLEVLG